MSRGLRNVHNDAVAKISPMCQKTKDAVFPKCNPFPLRAANLEANIQAYGDKPTSNR